MRCKHIDVVKVKVLKDYTLRLQFEDGTQGEVDISKIVPFKGIFEPLNDKNFFSKVSINSDMGAICWENGADVSPTYLYNHISKNNHPNFPHFILQRIKEYLGPPLTKIDDAFSRKEIYWEEVTFREIKI